MGDLMQRVWDRALERRIPLAVQFDLTYRCNERCIHCYLDHDDHGELTTAKSGRLDQLSSAGTLFFDIRGANCSCARTSSSFSRMRARCSST
jgi:hypothetical protein